MRILFSIILVLLTGGAAAQILNMQIELNKILQNKAKPAASQAQVIFKAPKEGTYLAVTDGKVDRSNFILIENPDDQNLQFTLEVQVPRGSSGSAKGNAVRRDNHYVYLSTEYYGICEITFTPSGEALQVTQIGGCGMGAGAGALPRYALGPKLTPGTIATPSPAVGSIKTQQPSEAIGVQIPVEFRGLWAKERKHCAEAISSGGITDDSLEVTKESIGFGAMSFCKVGKKANFNGKTFSGLFSCASEGEESSTTLTASLLTTNQLEIKSADRNTKYILCKK